MLRSTLKKRLLIFFLILSNCTILAQDNSCDYFGLNQPNTTPKDFNPKLLDLKGSFKFNVDIKRCDEIYFTTIDSEENIYFSKHKNAKWSQPKRASFSDPNYGDADPFMTKDGKRIYLFQNDLRILLIKN